MDEQQHQKYIEDMKTHLSGIVEISIKKYVNGKIDNLTEIANEAKTLSQASASTAYQASLKNETLNKEIRGMIIDLGEQIKPITEIYTDLEGTKKVLKWVFMTLSFIIGFALSVKALFFNK